MRFVGYLVCAAGFLLCVVAFYPGYVSPDSVRQLAEARVEFHRLAPAADGRGVGRH